VLPEPLFSKAFAATLTARLALAVGLLELRNIAQAFLQLYREAQAARTVTEVEAVAERFGRALGGTALRVLIMVASYGVAKALPNTPPGGLGPLLSPPRYAMAGGLTFQAATTAHIVTVSQCRDRLVEALKQLANEICTPGSRLHRLATKPQD
jgi:hypothetical protein